MSNPDADIYKQAEALADAMRPEELPKQAFIYSYVANHVSMQNAEVLKDVRRDYDRLVKVLLFIGTPFALAVLGALAKGLIW